MKHADDFFKELMRQSKVGYKDYDAEILISAKIFTQVSDASDVVALKAAMNRILSSQDGKLLHWARGVFASYGKFTDIMTAPAFVCEVGEFSPRSRSGAPRGLQAIVSELQTFARENDVAGAIDFYAGIQGEEAKAFFDALEVLLSSSSLGEREFGVDLSVTLVLARLDPPWARAANL